MWLFNGVPGVERYGFRSLRMCMSGGAAAARRGPAEVRSAEPAENWWRLRPDRNLPVTHVNPPEGSPKIASIGLPIPDTEARILDLATGTREMPVGEAGEIVIPSARRS